MAASSLANLRCKGRRVVLRLLRRKTGGVTVAIERDLGDLEIEDEEEEESIRNAARRRQILDGQCEYVYGR